MIILHALTKSLWDTYRDQDSYGQRSLDRCGFIHCSDLSTYERVAPNFKDEVQEMLLLVIDTEKVTSPIQWEDLDRCGVRYPHIYGPLNKDAVVMVLPHLWTEQREWLMNEELKALSRGSAELSE